MATLVLTVTGDDRPGVVSALSAAINAHGGSWEMSQLSRLAGKFAGSVVVAVDDERVDALVADLLARGARIDAHDRVHKTAGVYAAAQGCTPCLDALLQAEKRRRLARAGGEVPPQVSVSAQERPELLREVYRRADIPKPRNFVGLAKDIPQEEMESLLLAAQAPTADTMRDLAVARGARLVADGRAEAVVAGGVDELFDGDAMIGEIARFLRPEAT